MMILCFIIGGYRDKCDFSLIRDKVERDRMVKKAKSKDEKKEDKDKREELMTNHGYCLLDSHRVEKVGNFTIEPPCLFRGRGLFLQLSFFHFCFHGCF